MNLDIHLSDEETERLRTIAEQARLSLPECARALLIDQLKNPSVEFERAAGRVLEKNLELYRRLS